MALMLVISKHISHFLKTMVSLVTIIPPWILKFVFVTLNNEKYKNIPFPPFAYYPGDVLFKDVFIIKIKLFCNC